MDRGGLDTPSTSNRATRPPVPEPFAIRKRDSERPLVETPCVETEGAKNDMLQAVFELPNVLLRVSRTFFTV
jgi:hypothetical protein